MSTKASISYSDKHHFYEECLDSSNVYLEVNNPPGVELSHRDFSGVTATLIIPIEIWRQVVEDWINSHWAEHPDMDNAEIKLNPNFDALFAAIKSKKETEDEEDEEDKCFLNAEREFMDGASEAKDKVIHPGYVHTCDVCERVVDEYETVVTSTLSGVVMCAGKMKDSCKSPSCEEEDET